MTRRLDSGKLASPPTSAPTRIRDNGLGIPNRVAHWHRCRYPNFKFTVWSFLEFASIDRLYTINARMIPGRRSHDVRPMSPTVVASERRPSASVELSRPSFQNLSHQGSDGGNGRGDSSGHTVGDAVSRRLAFLGVGDPRSSSTTPFLPPRSHSRLDSNGTRDAPSNMSSSALVSASKQHASPSKVCVDRFYS